MALPLFTVLLLSTSFWVTFSYRTGAQLPESGSGATTADSGAIDLGHGARALLSEGAILDTSTLPAILQEGSVLVTGEGIIEVAAGSAVLRGMNGAFSLTVNGSTVSVAALTSPVFVTIGDASMIVPAGLQWDSPEILPGVGTGSGGYGPFFSTRVLSSLPKYFITEKMTALADLSANDASLPLPQAELDQPGWLSLFLLPAAAEKSKEELAEEALGALRFRLEHDDSGGALALLEDPDFSSVFTLERARDVFAILLARLPVSSLLRIELLSRVSAERSDLWQLAALHPKLRSTAWVIATPAMDAEVQAVFLLTLPQSNIHPQILPSLAMKRWEDATAVFLQESTNPTAFFTSLSDVLLPLVQWSLAQGYPERARTLSVSLTALAEPYGALLSSATTAALTQADTLTAQNVVLDLSAPVSSGNGASSVAAGNGDEGDPFGVAEEGETVQGSTSLDMSVVAQRAYGVFASNGGLFSLETKIVALDAQRARVTGLYISGTLNDHVYDFTYDVESQIVSDIVMDGTKLPNAIVLNAFLGWAKL